MNVDSEGFVRRSLNIDKIKERLEIVTQNLHEFSHIVGKQEKLIHVRRFGIENRVFGDCRNYSKPHDIVVNNTLIYSHRQRN